jgi:hypothetical protein
MKHLWIRLGLSVGWLVLLTTAGCTTRKPTAGQLPPSYPAVPTNSVRILAQLPSPPYDVIDTITVQTDAAIGRDKMISEIRQRAGNSGANVIIVLSEKVFIWRNAAIHQRLHTRRIVARAIRLP